MPERSTFADGLSQRLNRPVLFGIVAMVLGLPAAEAGCRVLDPAHLAQMRHAPDPILGFRMAPKVLPDGSTDVNAEGIPNEPIPDFRGEHEFRVLCLGDSITAAGTLQRREDRWTNVLEGRLQTSHPAGRVRAINAGIEGYRIVQMRQLLDDLGPRYQPDVVVVMFQDPSQDMYIPPNPRLAWRYPFRGWLYRQSLVKSSLLWATGIQSFGSWPGAEPMAQEPDARKAIASNLASFARFAQQNGEQMLFALAPRANPAAVGAHPSLPPEIYSALRAETEAMGAAMWWPENAASLRALGDAAFGEGDAIHLSQAGNAAVGNELAEEILRRGWL